MNYRNGIGGCVALAIAAAPLAGCATGGAPLSTNQRIAGCTASVIGGSLLGALLGSQVDGRRGGGTRRGAVIGALVGGGACAVWLAFENEKDRRRMAEAQLVAARTGRPVNDSWTGDDGRVRAVRVVPSTQMQAMVPQGQANAASMVCRETSVTPSVDNQTAAAFVGYVCRDSAGNWQAAPSRMVVAAS